VHGDPNDGNLLVTADGPVLLDWETLHLSDPLHDLAQVLWWGAPRARWPAALARFGASADDGGVIERLHLRVALRAGHPLRGLGVDTVVIAGVTTENCCHATARDAFFRNYRVVCLCPMRPVLPTTSTSARAACLETRSTRAACLETRSTRPRWWFCLTPRLMFSPRTNSSRRHRFHNWRQLWLRKMERFSHCRSSSLAVPIPFVGRLATVPVCIWRHEAAA
jgi:hypothetical protein